jgi:hypothetical protein
MTQQLAHRLQIRTMIKQVRCNGVTEYVRTAAPEGRYVRQGATDNPLGGPRAHRASTIGDEQRFRITRAAFRQNAPNSQVLPYGIGGVIPDWNDSLFLPFPEDLDFSGLERKIVFPEPDQFAQSNSGTIEQFEHGAITERLRCPLSEPFDRLSHRCLVHHRG